MKKITLLILMIIVFNFICFSFFQLKVYASGSMSMKDFKQLDEGMASINGSEIKVNISDSDVGSVASKFSTVLTALSVIGVKLMSSVVEQGGYYYTDSDYSTDKLGIFTINSLVFGEYMIFNAKPYETSSDLIKDIKPTPDDVEPASDLMSIIDKIKEKGASIGKLLEKISFALCVPLMLISIYQVLKEKAEDKLLAVKKIFTKWLIFLILLIFYRYILTAIHVISDKFIDMFWNMRKDLESAGYMPFEATIEKLLINSFQKTGGVTSLAYSIEFFTIVVMQILFMKIFAIRAFLIIFLSILAPVCILIDVFMFILGKNIDVLGIFFKIYMLSVFLQPIFALFYIIFFFSLSEIVINVPALGIILLIALYRVKDIIKAISGLRTGLSIL